MCVSSMEGQLRGPCCVLPFISKKEALDIECGVGQNAFVEKKQNQLLASPSVLLPVGDSTGKSLKKRPLTADERQRPNRLEQCRARDLERQKKSGTQELKKQSEAAALHQREKKREKQRRRRLRKREENSRMKGTGHASMDFLQTNTDSHLDINSSELKAGQYAIDTHEDSEDLWEFECDTPDEDDKATCQVKLRVQDSSPAEHNVDPANENGFGVCQISTCEVKKQSEAAALHQRKKKRDRQREKRLRKREENSRMKGTGHASMDYLQTKTDSHLEMKSSELKISQHAIDTHEDSKDLWEFECDTPDEGDNATCQVKLEVQDNSPAEHDMNPANENGFGVCQISTCEVKKRSEAAASRLREKKREKQRGWRLRKREENSRMKGTRPASIDYLQTNTDSHLGMNSSELKMGGESGDSVMPRIVAVWSMSEGSEHGVRVKQENITQYLTSNCDNSGCNVSNVPKASTMI
ncbi:uncharacterized protein LOC105445065 [Strongylocentrotus purpuratus]|uniref:Uncharacterized protein n=1 Tax=Strongylocentrotus purpuratus TaxID=7668 RepID=A0A7M7HL65_STRPU|nr:uncharacterized protein LOC105445065 [Strongylocentrotus purpuratus]